MTEWSVKRGQGQVDWTDHNPQQTCMAERLDPIEGPEEPAKLLVTIAVLGAP